MLEAARLVAERRRANGAGAPHLRAAFRAFAWPTSRLGWLCRRALDELDRRCVAPVNNRLDRRQGRRLLPNSASIDEMKGIDAAETGRWTAPGPSRAAPWPRRRPLVIGASACHRWSAASHNMTGEGRTRRRARWWMVGTSSMDLSTTSTRTNNARSKKGHRGARPEYGSSPTALPAARLQPAYATRSATARSYRRGARARPRHRSLPPRPPSCACASSGRWRRARPMLRMRKHDDLDQAADAGVARLVPLNYTYGDRFRQDRALTHPAWAGARGLPRAGGLARIHPAFFSRSSRPRKADAHRVGHTMREANRALA